MGKWAPSRKWWAATVVAVATFATAAVQAGEWSTTLTITAIGVAASRLLAWLLPNGDETKPSGIRRRVRRRKPAARPANPGDVT